jgi:acetoin utilization deacetylase AcuC-like enzyme
MRIFTDEACLAYRRAGHPERPERVSRTLDLLRRQTDVPITFEDPPDIDDGAIRRAHTVQHLAELGRGIDFDADTPAFPDLEEHARRSVAGAFGAMRAAAEGEPAMSVLRPPGHHALPERAMGFCYLNQVAICALAALAEGRRVAVYDFDVHHGNGTEAILRGREGCAFFSIHQYPFYPGTGAESFANCRNFPMRADAPRAEYVDAFRAALDELMAFRPDVIAVSAGFDAFRGDPLSQENVEGEDYELLGSLLRASGLPVFAVLEGGYSDELPDLVLAFLKGLSAVR